MIKRFLELGIGPWKERRLKGTYLRYYIENPDDERNILARWLDFIGVIFVTWALSFILLAGITKTQKALLLSAALLVVGLVLTDMVKRRQLKKRLLHTRRKLAGESYLEKISNMENSEFYDFATNLFKRYGIKISSDQMTTGSKDEALAATFEQRPVWIKFFNGEMSTIPAAVEKFLDNLTEENYTAGLVVTREKASSELKQVIVPYRNKMHIELLDKNRMAKLAAYLDHPSSSSLAEEFSQLKQHQEKSKRKLLLRELLGTRQKTEGYALSAGLLFVLFAFWQTSTALSLVYLLFAMINTTLAATSFIMQRQKTRAQLLKP